MSFGARQAQTFFTEGFRCLRDGIEVIDFNLFDYRTGALLTRQ
jgi:hypothetical protein